MELFDAEFGEVRIKTVRTSRHVRLRVDASGQLVATIPHKRALGTLQKLLNDSRSELRPIIEQAKESQPKLYENGQKIGASHSIHFIESATSTPRGSIKGREIHITMPAHTDITNDEVQNTARRTVRRALQQQAESYLPRQLRYLAEQHGFVYSQVTFGNAKGRWGSCTSKGVIRLNIALMKLPLGLIDYVLIHELAHTKELNHSSRFWSIVEAAYPHYKSARKQLKQFNPYL